MSEMIRPAGHRVLVKLDPAEAESKGGIIFADQTIDRVQRTTERGTVIELGKTAYVGFADGEPWVKAGDRIGFASHAGVLVEHEGDTYRAMNDEDIYLIYERGE